MGGRATIVIEHLEDKVGKWLLIEYEASSGIVGRGNLYFTNVKDAWLARRLLGLGRIYRRSIADISLKGRIIVLDPQAEARLEPEDFQGSSRTYVVIGGILGDHPPRGRTRKMLTSRMKGAVARNIGKAQFTINGAVYVAWQVSKGRRLEEIPTVEGVEIDVEYYKGIKHVITLPYAYPVVDGRPLIPRRLLDYLRRGIAYDEVEEIGRWTDW